MDPNRQSAARARAQRDLGALRARRTRTRRRNDYLKLAGAVIVIALAIWGGVVGYQQHNTRKRHCVAQGGHVTHHTTYITVHGHTDSDTTYYCLTPNGGTLDVW